MTFYDDLSDENLVQCGVCQNLNDPGEAECGYCGEVMRGAVAHKVYVEKTFSPEHLEIIGRAQGFLREYEADGFSVSLRQLYYQFVANGKGFPNTEQSYKRLGGIINSARLAGHISFESIEDRGRSCDVPWAQPDPSGVLTDIEYSYSEDYWADQDTYVEVWVEKDALSGVVERPCRRLQVPHLACKGYMSASAAWEAGKRFEEAAAAGKDLVLIHLGDHDPSGIDMTRDNGTRLEMFAESGVEVSRIGLNMDQIIEYAPPPNPTKVTDSRAKDYLERFGETSWELDALSPKVIADLIDAEVRKHIDVDRWNSVRQRERENRAMIAKIGQHSAAVFDFVKDL